MEHTRQDMALKMFVSGERLPVDQTYGQYTSQTQSYFASTHPQYVQNTILLFYYGMPNRWDT